MSKVQRNGEEAQGDNVRPMPLRILESSIRIRRIRFRCPRVIFLYFGLLEVNGETASNH